VTAKIKRELRRRSAVEPVIGHLKAEHRWLQLPPPHPLAQAFVAPNPDRALPGAFDQSGLRALHERLITSPLNKPGLVSVFPKLSPKARTASISLMLRYSSPIRRLADQSTDDAARGAEGRSFNKHFA
jgi:hypothetical protein